MVNGRAGAGGAHAETAAQLLQAFRTQLRLPQAPPLRKIPGTDIAVGCSPSLAAAARVPLIIHRAQTSPGCKVPLATVSSLLTVHAPGLRQKVTGR